MSKVIKKVAPFSIFVLKILNPFVILSNHSSYIYASIYIYMGFFFICKAQNFEQNGELSLYILSILS